MPDPNWDDVVFLSGFEGASPVDESALAHTVTLSGSASLSTTSPAYGSKSLSVTGGSACASIANHASFNAEGINFTAEGTFRFTSVASDCCLFSHIELSNFASLAGTNGWMLRFYAGFGLYFEWFEAGSYWSASTSYIPAVGTDIELAVDWDGSSYRVYADGVMVGESLGTVDSHTNASAPLLIGAANVSGSPTGGMTGFIDEFRFTVGTARYASDSGYTPTGAAFERGSGPDLDDEIIDGIGVADASGLGENFFDTVAEGVATSLTSVETRGVVIDDIFSSIAFLDPIRAQPALAAAGVGVSPATVGTYGQVIREQLRIALTQITNHNAQLSLSDEVDFDPALAVGLPAIVAEGIGIDAAEVVEHVIQIIEQLELTPVLGPMFLYGKTVSETIGVAEVLARFLGADISEGIGTQPALAGVAAKLESVSEGVGIAEALSPQLLISVTAADTIEITAEDALNFVLFGDLADNIELSAAYLSPGDGITTWVMNTRSGAVSEYTNFAFNSFAKFGHKYLAASESGLYELIGDDDDGTDIVSQIKSGFAQWAGSKFTMFKAAYLAVRGGGDYVLKLTTGDGKTYSYGVSARDMRTTKVNIGKGIRTRYFAFELISDGDDYDLESLEFVPIVTDRRV
jgi:hypothetical protein